MLAGPWKMWSGTNQLNSATEEQSFFILIIPVIMQMSLQYCNVTYLMEQSKFLTFLPIIVRMYWTAATTKAFSLRWVKARTFSITLVVKNLLQHWELRFSKGEKKTVTQNTTERLNENREKRSIWIEDYFILSVWLSAQKDKSSQIFNNISGLAECCSTILRTPTEPGIDLFGAQDEPIMSINFWRCFSKKTWRTTSWSCNRRKRRPSHQCNLIEYQQCKLQYLKLS